jgi:hypothetical protein
MNLNVLTVENILLGIIFIVVTFSILLLVYLFIVPIAQHEWEVGQEFKLKNASAEPEDEVSEWGINRTQCIELFFGDTYTNGIVLEMASKCWELLK